MAIGFELALKEMRRTDVTLLYELIASHLGWIRGDGNFKPVGRFKDGVPYRVGLNADGELVETPTTEGEFERSMRLIQQGKSLVLGVREYRFYRGVEVVKVLVDIRTNKVSAQDVIKYIKSMGAY